MKKFMTICMCGLMAAVLATGCSKKTDDAGTQAATEAAETTAVETTAGTADGTGSQGAGIVDTGTTETKVTLGEYIGVKYTPMDTEITDEDVEKEIQGLLEANPVVTEVARAAQEGDIVNIDYVGKKDGVAFDGGTASGYDLTLGSGSFIDGFEDGLIGAKAGEKKSLDLTFPETYFNAELAGQAVVFEVTVNAVKESVPAELTDAFIAENTDSETIDEYRVWLKDELKTEMEAYAAEQKKNSVMQAVMNACEVTIADSDVQPYYEEQYALYEQQAAAVGIDLETMLSYYGLDIATFQSLMQEMTRSALMEREVLQAIAKKENITVTQEEREQLAEEYGYENVDSMIELESQEDVDNYILQNKVIEFLADNAIAEE